MQLFGHALRRKLLERELQTAREHGDRNLLRIGRREHKLHMLRRFFERFEHRVERALREHVHLVDQVHLVASGGRGVARVVDDLAHVVDAGVRRRIKLQQIGEAPSINVDACLTDPTGRGGNAGLAIQSFRKDARDRRLAHAASAGQQIRLM